MLQYPSPGRNLSADLLATVEALEEISTSQSAVEDFETGLRRDEKGDFVPFKYDTLKKDFTLGC
jgi:hypothetical protein